MSKVDLGNGVEANYDEATDTSERKQSPFKNLKSHLDAKMAYAKSRCQQNVRVG